MDITQLNSQDEIDYLARELVVLVAEKSYSILVLWLGHNYHTHQQFF